MEKLELCRLGNFFFFFCKCHLSEMSNFHSTLLMPQWRTFRDMWFRTSIGMFLVICDTEIGNLDEKRKTQFEYNFFANTTLLPFYIFSSFKSNISWEYFIVNWRNELRITRLTLEFRILYCVIRKKRETGVELNFRNFWIRLCCRLFVGAEYPFYPSKHFGAKQHQLMKAHSNLGSVTNVWVRCPQPMLKFSFETFRWIKTMFCNYSVFLI